MADRIRNPFERPMTVTERLSGWVAWTTSPWSRRRDEFELHLLSRINRLGEIIMASTADIINRIDAATTEVANDLRAVKDALAAATTGVDAAKQAAVDEALAQLDAPIARLEALGADPSDPVPPAPEPAPQPVPEPAPEPPVA